jgi:transposase
MFDTAGRDHIESPRGAVVETLLEHGFAVFSINPKQLDRFRDRYSPAGAKDDRRDAFVLADALRTDMHCLHLVKLDEPVMIRLRELSRLDDELAQEQNRAVHRLREQFHRFFPQLLQLCQSADEPWLWDLLESAPWPARAARLTEARIARLLQQHRIRRITAAEVSAVLKTKPLTLAPGAAIEHALLLLPRLRLLLQQRTDLARRIGALLEELATPDEGQQEHRDAAILLSLPGLGRKVAATMLSEASQAIAERDYHALRCYSGTAPITKQSGKKKIVIMRRSANERLRKGSTTGQEPVSSGIRQARLPMRNSGLAATPTAEPCAAWRIGGSKYSPPCSQTELSSIPNEAPLDAAAPRPPDRRPGPYCLTLDKG